MDRKEAWYVVQKTIFIIEKGLLLVGDKASSPEFTVAEGDRVVIVRPDGRQLHSRILDVCSSTRGVDDLLVDGLGRNDVPAGSKVRVLRSGKRRGGGAIGFDADAPADDEDEPKPQQADGEDAT